MQVIRKSRNKLIDQLKLYIFQKCYLSPMIWSGLNMDYQKSIGHIRSYEVSIILVGFLALTEKHPYKYISFNKTNYLFGL